MNDGSTSFESSSISPYATSKVELRPLTVLFGPNAAGKSNFIAAVNAEILAMRRGGMQQATARTAHASPVRIYIIPSYGTGSK